MGLMVHCCHPKTISTPVSFYFHVAEVIPLVEGSRCCVSKEVVKLEMPFGRKCQAQGISAETRGHCCYHLLVTALQ